MSKILFMIRSFLIQAVLGHLIVRRRLLSQFHFAQSPLFSFRPSDVSLGDLNTSRHVHGLLVPRQLQFCCVGQVGRLLFKSLLLCSRYRCRSSIIIVPGAYFAHTTDTNAHKKAPRTRDNHCEANPNNWSHGFQEGYRTLVVLLLNDEKSQIRTEELNRQDPESIQLLQVDSLTAVEVGQPRD